MLRRTEIRCYLLAALCSEEVYQTPDCLMGPLWENCDGTAAEVHDNLTGSIDDDNYAPFNLAAKCAQIIISQIGENGVVMPGRFQENTVTFQIDIVVNDASGHVRQNILDQIQCRILYRMMNAPRISDANDETKVYRSPLCLAERNGVRLNVRDDSEGMACYTIRSLIFTLDVCECIKKGDCDLVPLCFDFDSLTALSKDGDDVFVSDIEEDE